MFYLSFCCKFWLFIVKFYYILGLMFKIFCFDVGYGCEVFFVCGFGVCWLVYIFRVLLLFCVN